MAASFSAEGAKQESKGCQDDCQEQDEELERNKCDEIMLRFETPKRQNASNAARIAMVTKIVDKRKRGGDMVKL